MSELCTDNRFELIEKYKQELIDATNIEMAPDEMAVIDNILFRFWQMRWLDKLDEDAVPVVRCKDCRYGYHWFETRNGITDSWIECRNPNGLNRDVSEDGYCYCGERKDDDER